MVTRLQTILEVAFAVLVVSLLVPLWAARYPPFVDFPQYVATAAALANYGSAELRFSQYFALNFDTYSLLAPWLAGVLAKLFDPLVAAKLVVSVVLVGTPYALRALLRALRHPTEYALFALPLAYNTHVVMGFVNYVLGLMAMLWGLAFGVLCVAEGRRRWKIALAVSSVACLYCHVLPFALLQLGLLLTFAVGAPRGEWLRLAWPLAPAGLLALIGFAKSTTGWQTLPVGLTASVPDCPLYDPTRVVFDQIPDWINDVFRAQWDERLLLGLILTGMSVSIVGSLWQAAPAEPWRLRVRACLAGLAVTCLALYFVMPRTCDWIYPIHARFLFVGVMLAVLMLPALPRGIARGLALALAITSVNVVVRTTREFVRFNSEIGAFDAALAAIPKGHVVASVALNTGSRRTKMNTFQHFGQYNQARNGGLTQFSFATMHHWPVLIRPELALPDPGWGFQFAPDKLEARELDWAEYVLTRDEPPAAVARGFKQIYAGEHWHVFERKPQP